MSLHDALIKNLREGALRPSGAGRAFRVSPRTPEAPPSGCAPVSSSMTARRSRRTMSNGATSTIAAPGPRCCTTSTDGIEILDERTVRFDFKEPFLDFPRLIGTVQCLRRRLGRPGEVLREGRPGRVRRRSRSAPGPTSSSIAGAGHPARFRGVRGLLPRRSTSRNSRSSARPTRRPASRCSSAARPTSSTSSAASWSPRVKRNPKVMLAPVVSGNFWLEFPGLSGPEEPVPRQARAPGGQPRDRPRGDQPGGMRRARRGRRQLDQRRRRIRASNGRNGSTMSPRPRS